MAQIASVDFSLKRIYLHSDTVANGFDTMLAYFEFMALIVATPSYQGYSVPMTAEGNISKGSGTFTPRYVLLASLWRFVPYGSISHILRVLVEPVSLDGLSGSLVFDRNNLNVNIDIDEEYEKVEIREINTGSGVSAQDVTDISNSVNNILADDFANISVDLTPITNSLDTISANVDTIESNTYDTYKSIYRKRVFDKTTNTIAIYSVDGNTIEMSFDTIPDLSVITPKDFVPK